MQKEIKEMIIDAVKQKDNLKRDILKVLLGEIQTLESRQGSITKDQIISIIRKLIDSNRLTINAYVDPQPPCSNMNYEELANTDHLNEECQKLIKEIIILKELLPVQWEEEEICEFVTNNDDDQLLQAILEADSDGKATGLLMKAIKAAGGSVDGKLVATIAKMLREAGYEPEENT